MAFFLGSRGNDVAKLRATGELAEELRRKVAAAQGTGSDEEVHAFLSHLSAEFGTAAAAELAYQSARDEVLAALGAAQDAAGLADAFKAGHRLVAEQFARRRSPLEVHNAITALTEAALRRIFALARAEPAEGWCLLAGSWLGRREPSFCSGLVGGYVGRDAPAIAARVKPMLATLGVAIDTRANHGGLQWHASLDEWRSAVAALIAAGDAQCAALADLRWVAGSAEAGAAALAVSRGALARWRHSATFSATARQTSGLRLALGFFGGLRLERSGGHKGALNLDAQALYPMVANIRTLATAFNIEETSTVGRIRALVNQGHLNVDPAGRVMEACHHLQGWKMATELDGDSCRELDCYIRPDRLTEQDQEALKESLDAVAGLERLVVQQLTGLV